MISLSDLRESMQNEVSDVRTPTHVLDAALCTGRGRRHRRRAVGLGAVSAAAVVAVAVPAIGPERSTPQGAASPGITTSAAPTPGETTPPPTLGLTQPPPPSQPLADTNAAYADGMLIIRGDGTSVIAPGPVESFTTVGDGFAVMWTADDGSGAHVSLVWGQDPTTDQPVDFGVDPQTISGPLVSGTIGGDAAIAVGGQSIAVYFTDRDEAATLPEAGMVIGMVDAGVVYLPSAGADSYGRAPMVWNGVDPPTPLLAGQPDVQPIAFGSGALVVHDPDTRCGYAVRLDAPGTHLWDSCSSPTGPIVGVLSPDGAYVATGGATIFDIRTGVPAATLPADAVGDNPQLATSWLSGDQLLVGAVIHGSTRLAGLYQCFIESQTCRLVPAPYASFPVSKGIVFASDGLATP